MFWSNKKRAIHNCLLFGSLALLTYESLVATENYSVGLDGFDLRADEKIESKWHKNGHSPKIMSICNK